MTKSFTLLKALSLIILVLVFFLMHPSSTDAAQTVSNCTITNVGNSPTDYPLPPECASRQKVVYFCQNDYTYCDIDYSGCGVASTAMVFSTFGIQMDPPKVADLFAQTGFRQCGEGSQMVSAIQNLFPKYGFTYKQLLMNSPAADDSHDSRPALDLVTAKQYLDQGYLIIGSISHHIYVIDDVNPSTNQVHQQDPAGPGCRARAQGGYWIDNNYPWDGNGVGEPWYYAYAVKKTS